MLSDTSGIFDNITNNHIISLKAVMLNAANKLLQSVSAVLYNYNYYSYYVE